MIGPVWFIKNRYYRWYKDICFRAEQRQLFGYVERHHTIPRVLGGTDECVVALTYREHFICHWLLTKFTVGQVRRKMDHAFFYVARKRLGRPISSWQYERAKIAKRDAMLGVARTPKQREMIGNVHRGKLVSEETKAKMSKARKAYKQTPEQIHRISLSLKGRQFSLEWREKLSTALKGNQRSKGRTNSPETIAKMRDARVAYWAARRGVKP